MQDLISDPISALTSSSAVNDALVVFSAIALIGTLAVFMRQVAGLHAFGLFPTLWLTFVLYDSSLKVGITLALLIGIAVTLLAPVWRRWPLARTPRMVATMSFVMLGLSLAFLVAQWLGFSAPDLDVFAWLGLMIVSGAFLSAIMRSGARPTWLRFFQTLVVALIGVGLLRWTWLEQVVNASPFVFLLLLGLLNILIGRWTGLRLLEYFKFWRVIEHSAETTPKEQ